MDTVIFQNTVLGPYQLGELLGSGGMGMVYRAYQPNLDRHVALKLFFAAVQANTGLDQRFIREAEIVASLEHPHIVPIYDFGSTEAVRYVVMRLLGGGTLSDRLEARRTQQQPYSPSEVGKLLTPIADAIDYAHSKGIVHRDIKPSNIMFDERGWPYLVDFGIARLVKNSSSLTQTGSTLGTPAYMPPEQWMGKEVTGPSDVYALGAVIFEMLTLHKPFECENHFELMQMHLNQAAPFPQDITPGLPESVGIAVNQALQKDATKRYATAGSFAEAFSTASQGFASPAIMMDRPAERSGEPATQHVVVTPYMVSSKPTTEPEPRRKRRLPLVVGVLLIGLVACVASLIPGWLQLGGASPLLALPTATQTPSEAANMTRTMLPDASPSPTATLQNSPTQSTSTPELVQPSATLSHKLQSVTSVPSTVKAVSTSVVVSTSVPVQKVPTRTAVPATVRPTVPPATATSKPKKNKPTPTNSPVIAPTTNPGTGNTNPGNGNGNSGGNSNGNGGGNGNGNGNGNGHGKKP